MKKFINSALIFTFYIIFPPKIKVITRKFSMHFLLTKTFHKWWANIAVTPFTCVKFKCRTLVIPLITLSFLEPTLIKHFHDLVCLPNGKTASFIHPANDCIDPPLTKSQPKPDLAVDLREHFVLSNIGLAVNQFLYKSCVWHSTWNLLQIT